MKYLVKKKNLIRSIGWFSSFSFMKSKTNQTEQILSVLSGFVFLKDQVPVQFDPQQQHRRSQHHGASVKAQIYERYLSMDRDSDATPV